MTDSPMKINRQGRPQGSGIYDQRLPEIRVSSHQLKTYKKAAKTTGKSLSCWIRGRLDENRS